MEYRIRCSNVSNNGIPEPKECRVAADVKDAAAGKTEDPGQQSLRLKAIGDFWTSALVTGIR